MSYKSFSASQDALSDKGAAGKPKIIPMTKQAALKPGEAPAKAAPAVKS